MRDSSLAFGKVIVRKDLEGRKNCECYLSKKIQEINIGYSNGTFSLLFLSFFWVSVIFHSHFWLSLEQQSSRVHMSTRRQISIKLYDEIKKTGHIEFSENYLVWSYLVTLYTFNIQDTFASFKYSYSHKTQTLLWC